MVWFKSDDSFWRHRKVRKLGRDKLPAVGLWELSGTWSADNGPTDGFVPDEQIETWDPKHRYAKRLVDVGLWERSEQDGEKGYQFHDWPDYQPTRATIEAEREEWRTKKAAQRKAKRKGQVSPEDTPEDKDGTSQGNPRESPPRFPDPVPVPVPVPSSGYLGEGPSPDVPRGNPHPQRPSDTCSRHAGLRHPPPCGACADARRTAEAWDTRQAARRAEVAAELEAVRADPRTRCEHGTDGGTHLHPDTGLPLCALCRAREAAS